MKDVMHTARLAATIATALSLRGDELRSVPSHVDLLEVRADRVGDIDPDWLRSHFRGRLLFTLRSTAEGGACALSPPERISNCCAPRVSSTSSISKPNAIWYQRCWARSPRINA